MSHFKIPTDLLLELLPVGLLVAGAGAAIVGVYLLWGLAVALIVGGVLAAAAGLLADFD